MASLIPAEGEATSTVVDTASRLGLLNISEEQRKDEQLSLLNAPIVSSYNDCIRPLLDTVDSLRYLKIKKEAIQLPTIVVVGDQSSGKSSVLESLTGISLPKGQGICTRVPLIMRLQNHTTPQPELFLIKHDGSHVPTDEEHIAGAIITATEEIAGYGKGISKNPLILMVKKRGAPDLTMIDLPGIIPAPDSEQPKDMYEQILNIIMEYITPEDNVILNVLSGTMDFSDCESIKVSQRVDKNGQRTLTVVTKVDQAPEGLLEKVTMDDVNIGLGYICVRNHIGDESYDKAREEEAKLFDNHPLLSKINKSSVGIPVLAERLVKAQAALIVKRLPDIVKKINDKLSSNVEDLNKLPINVSSTGETMIAFMHILGSAKESLRKILLRGEFAEYPDEPDMHCTARMAEMLNKYSEELLSKYAANGTKSDFLLDEISILKETKAIGLPNFLPTAVLEETKDMGLPNFLSGTAFLTLIQKNIEGISFAPIKFVEKIWDYVERVAVSILMRHSDNYPQLLSYIRRITQNLVSKKKKQSVDWVRDMVEMEKLTYYTCNTEYVSLWNKLMSHQNVFMETLTNHSKPTNLHIDGYGVVDVAHLRDCVVVAQEAFDLKMRFTAYWKIVLRRLVDCTALHLFFDIQNLVNKEMEKEIINELIEPNANGLERMLEECPTIIEKRKRLNDSIKLLNESKDLAFKIIDKIAANAK